MTDYKLVPVEPTEAMIAAARDQHEGEPYLPVSLYKAMIAAAPAVQGETDVAGLVDALEDIAQWSERWTAPGHPVATIARKALAAYRQ